MSTRRLSNGTLRAYLTSAVFGAALVGACATTTPAAVPETSPETSPTQAAGLPFIEDDYAAALARAKAENKPLFVDTWAPWCHSCLALKTEVFPDPALAAIADHFVWLSLDVEKPSAAPFLARFPSQALPTLYVIDARTESAVLRWLGTGTAPQLVQLLEDARRTMPGVAGGTAEVDATAAAREANRRVFALARESKYDACAELAAQAIRASTPGTVGRADIAISGLGCASAMDAKDARRAGLEDALLVATLAIAEDHAVLTDDRSGAYSALVDAHKARGDVTRARALATAWSALLDDAAAHASTREARAALDAHRVLAYLELGAGERALPMLALSETEFPADYNPAARAAYVLFQLGRLDEALEATARAKRLVYGPRRLRILSLEADIFETQHDVARAIASLDEALAAAAALPEAQRSQKGIAALTTRRQKLAETATPPR